jgi:ribosomal protein L7/L12
VARADIALLFEPGPQASGFPRFEPGRVLRGRVRVTPDSPVRCSHLWVRAVWQTEGRGDCDSAKAAEQDVFQGDLAAGAPAEFPFELPLPREPWSFAGHYVSIVWRVEVDVDVPWSVNPRHHQPFVCAPAREAATPAAGADLFLTHTGATPEAVAEVIQHLLPALSPEQAAQIVTVLPFRLLQNVSDAEADTAARLFYDAGASVEIHPAGSA